MGHGLGHVSDYLIRSILFGIIPAETTRQFKGIIFGQHGHNMVAGRRKGVIQCGGYGNLQARILGEMPCCRCKIIGFLALDIREDTDVRPVPGAFAGWEEADIRQPLEGQVEAPRGVSHPNLLDVLGKFRVKMFRIHKG